MGPDDDLDIPDWAARAVGLGRSDRTSVATRLAELGGLHEPERPETIEFLVATFVHALSAIPASGIAWSWGEFHNRGLQPLVVDSEDERSRLALCAEDLGLDAADGASHLLAATERMLGEVQRLLEGAGVATHGWTGVPGR